MRARAGAGMPSRMAAPALAEPRGSRSPATCWSGPSCCRGSACSSSRCRRPRCTNVLWTLAALAGLPPDRFDRSPLPEVSPALTVHDMNLWPDELRLIALRGGRARAAAGRGRLAALLARARPRAAAVVGLAVQAAAARAALRRRLRRRAVVPARPVGRRARSSTTSARSSRRSAGGEGEDVHWAVQHDLIAQLPLTHVGRVERIEETLALLSAHVGAPLAVPGGTRTAARCRCRPGLYDERVRGDPARAPPAPTTPPSATSRRAVTPSRWPRGRPRSSRCCRCCARRSTSTPGSASCTASPSGAAAACRAPSSGSRPCRRARRAARARRRSPTARATPTSTCAGRGRRRRRAAASPRSCGSATRRATSRGCCRRCSARSSRVLLLDNGSTDGSADVARRVAREAGAEDRLDVRDYPFAVARCGDEHLGTPPDSVHSLTYFYNWSFAHVRTAYALKWDGDMVLTDAAAAALRDLAWQLEAAELVVKVPRYPLYVVDDRRAFVDTLAAQLRAVGLAERARLQLRQGDRLGAAAVGGRHADADAPRLGLRRAQAPRRRRVRPLVAHRLRRVGAHAAQAPRVGGLPGARRRRGAARGRRRGRGAGGRARDRARAHELAAAPRRRPLAGRGSPRPRSRAGAPSRAASCRCSGAAAGRPGEVLQLVGVARAGRRARPRRVRYST